MHTYPFRHTHTSTLSPAKNYSVSLPPPREEKDGTALASFLLQNVPFAPKFAILADDEHDGEIDHLLSVYLFFFFFVILLGIM